MHNDMTGQKFNMLTIIEDNGGGVVKVRCDCGTIKTCNRSNIVSGKVKSCGCIRRGRKRTDILKSHVGERFGKLIVIEELHGGRVKTQCDCGNIKIVNKAHLLLGNITSCGCNATAEHLCKITEANRVDGTNLLLIKDSKPSKRNTSGVRGVSYKSKKGKWEASICVQGKTHYLGMYGTLEQAAAARKAAEEKYYKPLLDKWKAKEKIKNA